VYIPKPEPERLTPPALTSALIPNMAGTPLHSHLHSHPKYTIHLQTHRAICINDCNG
jgi:hypothetical protein